jgi:RNA polymerase sigma-70 factor (ECF subfamily)
MVAKAGTKMTDSQIAFSLGLNDMPLRPAAARTAGRLSALTMLLGVVRFLHLMAPTTVRDATTTSAVDATTQRELLQCFQDTIVPHLDAAYNFARFLSRDADAAEDIVQEAFLRAYRNFVSYRGGDPRAWLFAIVRNCCHAWRQQHRRKARFERHMGDDSGGDSDEGREFQVASQDDTPETATIRAGEQQRVRAVIAGLSEPMREILVLRELEDLSYRQIAEVIDAPIGTVMSRLARARREFGETWNAEGKSETAR